MPSPSPFNPERVESRWPLQHPRLIAGQEEHHRKLTFQDEFRRLLQRYELTFDEAYVWD